MANENYLNLGDGKIIPHKLGHYQIHIKFNNHENVQPDESVRTHYPVKIRGINVQVSPNGFYFCVANRNIKHIGHIIYKLTNTRMSVLDRIKEDIEKFEQEDIG